MSRRPLHAHHPRLPCALQVVKVRAESMAAAAKQGKPHGMLSGEAPPAALHAKLLEAQTHLQYRACTPADSKAVVQGRMPGHQGAVASEPPG